MLAFMNLIFLSDFVKLQSCLTVQSRSVGLGVDFVFPPSQQVTSNPHQIYQKKMDYRLEIWQLDITLLVMGGPFQPPLSENRDFSGTEHPLDRRLVSEFKSVRCDPVEEKSALSFSV